MGARSDTPTTAQLSLRSVDWSSVAGVMERSDLPPAA